jgi:potassium inwardly-rectifying channel subfamily J
VTFQKENGQYQIDFSRFHNTLPMETPQCSAKELAEMGDRGHHNLAVDDDEEITSIGSTKNDKFPSPYVIKRHGFAQTDFDYDEDDLISQESSVQSRQTNESETLL